MGQDGERHQPYVIHRALLGSMERFMGVLIEHYGGAFPTWLAPVQAVVIPIADRHLGYGQSIADRLSGAGLRAEMDDGNERMGAKIRSAQVRKIPYMLVVGDREEAADAAALRLRSGQDLGAVPADEIVQRLKDEVARRE